MIRATTASTAFRKARRRDAEFLFERLTRSAAPDAPEATMSLRRFRRRLHRALRDPTEIHFIAERDGEPLAYCALHKQAERARGRLHMLGGSPNPAVVDEALEEAISWVRIHWGASGLALEVDGASPVELELQPPSAEEIRAFKDRAWSSREVAASYEKRVRAPRGSARAKHFVEVGYALRYARTPVLDAGAGTGRFACAIAARGTRVTALDISWEMLRIARAQAGAPHTAPLPAVAADLLRLPFDERAFASIVSITVIEHLPHYRGALAELARVLAPGGTLVFQVRSGDYRKRFGAHGAARGATGFTVALDRAEIEALLGGLGLEPMLIAPYNLLCESEALKKWFGALAPALQKSIDLICSLPLVARAIAAFELGPGRRLPLGWCPCTMIVAKKVVARKPGAERNGAR